MTLLSLLVRAGDDATLATRFDAAVAEDHVDVILADGSRMSLDDAERALALKEERRVYLPLRQPLLRARRQALDPVALRIASQAHGAHDAVDATALRAFLDDTEALRAPALDVLASLAHGEVDDAAKLTRALDLPAMERPDVSVVVRATKDALPKHMPPPKRREAPRALCGHVVFDDDGGARLLTSKALRARRQRALMRGVASAYGHGLVGLALHAPVVLRAIDVSARDAESWWREAVTTTLIEARLAAAVMLAFSTTVTDPEAPMRDRVYAQREVAREEAKRAVGFAVGAELVDDLLMPPWPKAPPHTALIEAANMYLSARDRREDAGLLSPQGLLALHDLAEQPPAQTAAGASWRALFGEIS